MEQFCNAIPRRGGKSAILTCIDEYATTIYYSDALQRGDRVRIKEGYNGAGDVLWYLGKSTADASHVKVAYTEARASYGGVDQSILADAIEPYPYTREERIERAIEDALAFRLQSDDDNRALLYAILDAGV